LLANLVAKRCAEIDPPSDRAALWFVQWLSWQRNGLHNLAAELLRSAPLKEWRAVETAMSFGKPDLSAALCHDLNRLCLDPAFGLADVWEAVDDYRAKWIRERPAIAPTIVTRRMAEALEYAKDTRCLTLIDGPARTGKTFAAKDWCERSAGLARYVQVPCTNDDRAFFSAIASALGLSCSRNYKAAEIRDRIEETLASGDLLLVLDEAHYLWPQNWQRFAMPARVNWVMTALVNRGVPVALVTTPQFYNAQKQVERNTGWTSEQFIGRIGHVERLPQRLDKSDLFTVAKALLPEGDVATWKALAAYADLSKKHLASIEAIVKRAHWLARQDDRQAATSGDVKRAMKESVIPSDEALAQSLATPAKASRRTFAMPPRGFGEGIADTRRDSGFEDFTSRGEIAPGLVTK
jgi:hypothetical protein